MTHGIYKGFQSPVFACHDNHSSLQVEKAKAQANGELALKSQLITLLIKRRSGFGSPDHSHKIVAKFFREVGNLHAFRYQNLTGQDGARIQWIDKIKNRHRSQTAAIPSLRSIPSRFGKLADVQNESTLKSLMPR